MRTALLCFRTLGISFLLVLALGVAALVNARRGCHVFAASWGFVSVNATNRRPGTNLPSTCALGLGEAAFPLTITRVWLRSEERCVFTF